MSSVVGIMYTADQFGLSKLRKACLDYLHGCLEVRLCVWHDFINCVVNVGSLELLTVLDKS